MIAELSRDVVDCLEQIDVARERRKRRRAEVRHTRDVDGGTNSVVDRRIEPAVRELKTRFVESATAERGDVSGGTNSVVDRRIEPAVRELKTRFVESATAERGDVDGGTNSVVDRRIEPAV